MLTYIDAIRAALAEEMRRDESVILVGEDIGAYGGAFKATKGLLEEFGAERVIDAPIAESAIVGVCIGAAIRGLRPVAEMQFADFVTCGFSQLVVNAATFHYRSGQSVPMVVRLPAGGGVAAGPFHSRCPEAWFAHAPGLKVVVPATPRDARALMLAAIRDPDPVIYVEQKFLYRRLKEDVPADDPPAELGRALVRREGKDATVVTYGAGVHMALEAAEALAARGRSIEVVDLRSLVPYDGETVLASVRKTSRVLVLHEAHRTCGFGAEVAALVADEAFAHLDAPVRRLAALDAPTPAEATLEDFVRP
ncbi:MAG: alpha-ketoacid dehydrogenase subunit beta, partial [Myxococcota bacterium]